MSKKEETVVATPEENVPTVPANGQPNEAGEALHADIDRLSKEAEEHKARSETANSLYHRTLGAIDVLRSLLNQSNNLGVSNNGQK